MIDRSYPLRLIPIGQCSILHPVRRTATLYSTMTGSTMNRHQITELGELERAALEIIWERGHASADTVRSALKRPLKESTVRTVLTRLERKGYLGHTVETRTYIYSPRESRAVAAARAVKGILDRYCNGSLEEVLAGLVDARLVDQHELKRLAAKIAKVRRGDKS